MDSSLMLLVPKPEPVEGDDILPPPPPPPPLIAAPYCNALCIINPKLEPFDINGGENVYGSPLPILSKLESSSIEKRDATGASSCSSIVEDDRILKKKLVSGGRSREIVRVTYHDALLYRSTVRKTRAAYESLRLHFDAADVLAAPETKTRRRADLRAAVTMRQRGRWLYRDKRIVGSIPGVRIGDVFFYRMELCALGVHSEPQAGIDLIRPSIDTGGEPFATSIVLSGGYLDDVDRGDVIIYSGSGGREKNSMAHTAAQVLGGRNLALERSMAHGIEVRVVRGFSCKRSPSGKVYIYDGLYRVVKSWSETGKSGFAIFKFKLVRIEGQEPIGSAAYLVAEKWKGLTPGWRSRLGILSDDISNGKETIPISLFNDVDGDRGPLTFDYATSAIFPLAVFKKKKKNKNPNGKRNKTKGCTCAISCSPKCSCAKKNGGVFAYNANGNLFKGKPIVYECGGLCRCPESCPNRVSQKGIRHCLQVFRSKETEWGVRSLDVIRAGEFVCELAGVVLPEEETISLYSDYDGGGGGGGFVYPSLFPPRWSEWGWSSDIEEEAAPPPPPPPLAPKLSFSLDVRRKRNVGGFLSHSSTPNLFVQQVLFDHYNEDFPHLMAFAMESIPPLRELSIDYGVGE